VEFRLDGCFGIDRDHDTTALRLECTYVGPSETEAALRRAFFVSVTMSADSSWNLVSVAVSLA
jgi:hypothetical protein